MNSLGSKTASKRVNRWVDPSFSDLSAFKGAEHQVKPKGKSCRKRKTEGSGTFLIEPSHRDEAEAWVDRYSPRSQAELAVHKKKIEEVESWIREHIHTKGAILLLTGPSGCGKTVTVQVLSLELGIRVHEWINASNWEQGSQLDWRTGEFSSQITQFKEFLLRANKYNCLRLRGEGQTGQNKLILVEDFPYYFYRQPSSFHDVLRCFVKTSHCPLVFIVSDSPSREGKLRSLFPKDIQEALSITCISFNPVAPTTMLKVLSSIAHREATKSCGRIHVPEQQELELLSSGSSGDIRSAINSLQFLCFPDVSSEKKLCRTKHRAGSFLDRLESKQRTKKMKKTRAQEELCAIGGKDASLFLFRALGKILHCKRQTSEIAESPAEQQPGLPLHLCHHHRAALSVNPELVVEHSQTSVEFFNLYLHQNYLDFFSDMKDVEKASKYLSDADLLSSDWLEGFKQLLNWNNTADGIQKRGQLTSRDTMGDYGSSVATRGLLYSNSHQISVGFRPLHKPAWIQVRKKYHENSEAAQALFSSFCLTSHSLQTQLLPYLVKLSLTMRNQAQISFIEDVGRMALSRNPGRLKLETLTNQEMGLGKEEEEEDEEEETQTEDAQQASQPEPASNRLLLEDEEVLIEEYNSD